MKGQLNGNSITRGHIFFFLLFPSNQITRHIHTFTLTLTHKHLTLKWNHQIDFGGSFVFLFSLFQFTQLHFTDSSVESGDTNNLLSIQLQLTFQLRQHTRCALQLSTSNRGGRRGQIEREGERVKVSVAIDFHLSGGSKHSWKCTWHVA